MGILALSSSGMRATTRRSLDRSGVAITQAMRKSASRKPSPARPHSSGPVAGWHQPRILSKKALFRELGSPNPDSTLDALERELLERANRLGIGPQGYGGDTTALGIHLLTYPCHITSLPVAVTIECHAHRHKEAVL